jgi:hypothetical protein
MFTALCLPEPHESFAAAKIVHLTFPVSFAQAYAAGAEVYPKHGDNTAAAWQARVDMTLSDAEALVEGLRSLIATAKENVQAPLAAKPTALALAGLKIGPEPQPAPGRFARLHHGSATHSG